MDSRGATAGQPHLGNGKGTNLLLEPGKISSGIPGESGNTDGQQCGGASYSAVLRWKEELEINRHHPRSRSQCHHLQHCGNLQTQQSEYFLLHLAPADRDSETHVRHGSGFPVLFFCKGTGGLPVTESQILSSFLVSVTKLLTITNRANLITRLTLFCFIFCIDYV